MINTDYTIYNGYDTLFGTQQASGNNSVSNLLFKLNDYNTSVGFNSNKSGYVTQNVQNYLTDIKTASDSLKTAFAALKGNGKTSIFDKKALTSSDKDVLSVQTNSAYKGKFESASVLVSQVATSQENAGSAISSAGRDFQAGWNQIEIKVGDKTHQISFNVSSGDDNAAAMRKMADAINSKDIGVKAKITTDAGAKTSQLSIEGTVTGADSKNAFEIKDLTLGGGAAAITGITTKTREAQNALYSINGGSVQESKTNNVTIADGVTATLKKVSAEAVNITTETDNTAAINKAREMVNGFNALLDAADDNKSDRGANRLYNQLKGLSSTYASALERIGINVSSEGFLSIDSDKMKKAAESGELEKFFTDDKNASFGFANRLSRVAESVSNNPTDYIGKDKIQNSPTAGNSEMFSYLQSYRYNSIINTGLLFDYFF